MNFISIGIYKPPHFRQIALKSSNAVEFKIRLTSEASSNQTLLVAHLIHHSIGEI